MDIVVTTPEAQRENASLEADDVREAGGGLYFRRLASRPKYFHAGDRVYYVEAGYLRGYGVCQAIREQAGNTCDTTGREWPEGVYVWMEAQSWTWIKPIPMRGFQGWRYLDTAHLAIEIVGGWQCPMPEVSPCPNPVHARSNKLNL